MRGLRSALERVARTRSGIVSLTMLAALVVLAIVGPAIWNDAAADLDPARARQGASAAHWFGTDDLGRDVLARTFAATRLSLTLAVLCATIAAVLGCLLGALAGVARGRARAVVTGAVGWAIAFPPLIVALFVTAVLGPGGIEAVLAVAVALTPWFARVAQTLAVEVSSSDYVAAARTVGVSRRRLVTRYVLPNIAEPLVIQAAVTVGIALVSLSALSFLGLGVQPPSFDWGRMLAEGLDKLYTVPIVALAPAIAITLAGLTFSMLGDAIAQAFQPPGAKRPKRPRRARRFARRTEAPMPAVEADDALLTVDDLRIAFGVGPGAIVPVDGVSLELQRGELVGILGESGSGKSLTALALARLLPDGAAVEASRMQFEGRDMLAEDSRDLRHLLGTEMAVVFQDPMSSLNPALRVGTQLAEKMQEHRDMSKKAAAELAVRKLGEVHVPNPERRARQYPHEFSGGMRQRAMIAMGLMDEPSLILADEPTTALDVTVQAQILDLLREINRKHGTAVVLISHDVGVVADFCSRIVVMYAGRIVEDADTETLLRAPAHPYTQALIAAVPDLETATDRALTAIPGRPPTPDDLPPGCPFAPRCPLAIDACNEMPALAELRPGHHAACWRAGETAYPSQPVTAGERRSYP
jgi:peptide/nickel transport system permease protein